jgi:hypothetical protein
MLYVTPAPPLTELVSRSAVKGSLLLIPALAVTDGFTRSALVNLLAGVLAVTGAVVLFLAARPRLARPALAPRRWALQAAVTLVASPLALVPHARALLAVAGELLARGGGGPA